MTTDKAKPTASVYTLGCRVNQYESVALECALRDAGFDVLDSSRVCDVYIINTCTVTAESDRKARQAIRRARAANKNAGIIVCGCYAQTSPHDIAKIEGVDCILGTRNKLCAARLAAETAGRKNPVPQILVPDVNSLPYEEMCPGTSGRTRAYVKIEDGCDSSCSYCIIPRARGRVCSRPRAHILRELEMLAQCGFREVVLTGIETASYSDAEGDLVSLLADAEGVAGIERISLGSLEVSFLRPRVADRLGALRKLTPHLHLSLQSGDDRILRLMRRRYTASTAARNIEYLLSVIPEMRFSADIIVGFPTETEEEFENTVEFIKRYNFLHVHTFTYSKREGTDAALMDGQLPRAVKEARAARLAGVQRELEELDRRRLCAAGAEFSVLFETYDGEYAVGHTEDFHEIRVPSPVPLDSRILRVRAVSSANGVLNGELIPPA